MSGQGLTQRVKELAERYDMPMPQMLVRVTAFEAKVTQHSGANGFLMELKPGYKNTEVGVLPADWAVRSAHEFSTVKTGPFGTLLKASNITNGDGVPLISVGEIREVPRITNRTPRVSEAVTKRLPQYLLKKGDIVFGRKGGVDRSALIRAPQEGWFLGSDGISLRPSLDWSQRVHSLQFQSNRVQEWLIQMLSARRCRR